MHPSASQQPGTDSELPIAAEKLPQHIAVIMDGNGRWGARSGIGRLAGHRRGVDNVRTLVELCVRWDIPYLTLFAFSSENWKRPKPEVEWLIKLLSGALDREVKELHEQGVRLQFIGDHAAFGRAVQSQIKAAAALTAANRKLTLTVALNYGGRWDLVQACVSVARRVHGEQIAPEDISADMISQSLSTGDIPEPDLFIRTGGEKRMSNFLLWQLAYTELYFTDCYWPDFDQAEFQKALADYAGRVRRFGGIAAEQSGSAD